MNTPATAANTATPPHRPLERRGPTSAARPGAEPLLSPWRPMDRSVGTEEGGPGEPYHVREHKTARASGALAADAVTSASVLRGPDRTFLRRGGEDAENARLCKNQVRGVFSHAEVYRLIICLKLAHHRKKIFILKKQSWAQPAPPGPFPPFVTDLAGSDRDRS